MIIPSGRRSNGRKTDRATGIEGMICRIKYCVFEEDIYFVLWSRGFRGGRLNNGVVRPFLGSSDGDGFIDGVTDSVNGDGFLDGHGSSDGF